MRLLNRLAKHLGFSKKRPKRLKRGVVILRSGSTGLLGGKGSELLINGELQQFDWDKAMLLVSPKSEPYPSHLKEMKP